MLSGMQIIHWNSISRPAAATFNTHANAYLAKANFKMAIKDFSKAITLNPKRPIYYRGRAKAYRGIGNISAAEADEKQAEELDKHSGSGK